MIVFKNLKQILLNYDHQEKTEKDIPTYNPDQGSYMSIEAGISVRVRAKFCDFTGLTHMYTHKESGLRFSEERHFRLIEKMQNTAIQEQLSHRKAILVLK
jgi:hypothetical protein